MPLRHPPRRSLPERNSLRWVASFFAFCALIGGISLPSSAQKPGWVQGELPAVSHEDAMNRIRDRYEDSGDPIEKGLPTSDETTPTEEVTTLAEGLLNDPVAIFDYVRNYYRYELIFGSVNGAVGTLHALRGNDFDQSSLLVALLRESGVEANYAMGEAGYPIAPVLNWLGIEDTGDLTENANLVLNLFANAGIPVDVAQVGPDLFVSLTRVWVEAEIGGETFTLDPAIKEHDIVSGVDLESILGFDRNVFLAAVGQGATVEAEAVQGLNETAARDQLADLSETLIEHIEENQPSGTFNDLLGGYEIRMSESTELPTELPFADTVSDVTRFDTIPDRFRHIWRVEYQGIDHLFRTFETSSRRVTVFHTGSGGAPELRLEGDLLATGDPISKGIDGDFTLSVEHPYGVDHFLIPQINQSHIFNVVSSGSYTVVHDFNTTSEKLIASRNSSQSTNLESDLGPTSEALLGESLNIVGLSWVQQVHLFDGIADRVGGIRSISHHLMGLAGQQNGFFVDLPLSFNSTAPSIPGEPDDDPVFRAQTMMASAFEHGVLEQQQDAEDMAVSTIRLLTVNNENGDKTFLANSANFESVTPELKNYSQSDLAFLQALVDSGSQLVLPENGNITVNDFGGIGFVDFFQQGAASSIGMIISGGLSGGFYTQGMNFDNGLGNWATGLNDLPVDQPIETFVPLGQDPVDMAGGAFLFSRLDLSAGLDKLLGLRFVRSYSSSVNFQDGPLGHGWRHNYNYELNTHSFPGPGLGLRKPVEAVSAIVAAFVGESLLEEFDLARWMSAVLVFEWAMDEMTGNGVTVDFGDRAHQYVELPNGEFSPPPGFPLAMKREGDGFSVQGNFKTACFYDADGKVTHRRDTNGNVQTFTYDGEGRLEQVMTNLGDSLNFSYANDRLTEVSDSPDPGGRIVQFGYDDDGNLVSYTDAEDQTWFYSYDDQHRLESIQVPEGHLSVTNVYDDLGRVREQTDGEENRWEFFFTDFRNVERDPLGGEKTYIYDRFRRLIARENENGDRFHLTLDGQGGIVEIENALGNTKTFEFHEPTRRTLTATNPQNETTSYGYESFEFTFPPTNSKGNTGTTFTYFNNNRIEYPDGTDNEFTFDNLGNLETFSDRNGATSTFDHNDFGSLATYTNPAGGTVENVFNPDGTLASLSSTDEGPIQFEYDEFKRPILASYPDGATEAIEYNLNDFYTRFVNGRGTDLQLALSSNGALRKVTNENEVWELGYDRNFRLINILDPIDREISWEFDPVGNLVAHTDRNGGTTRLAYDPAGHLMSMTNAASDTFRFAYSAEAELLCVTSALGGPLKFNHDALGRTTEIIDTAGGVLRIGYDEVGKVVSLTDREDRMVEFDYDGMGHLIEVSNAVIGSVSYTRDEIGSLTSIVDPMDEEWFFERTPFGRLKTFTDPLSNVWNYAYNNRGRVSRVDFPEPGDSAEYAYDGGGFLTSVQYSDGETLEYDYDRQGRLASTNGFDVDYDERGQVALTQDPIGDFGATYDPGQRIETVTYGEVMTVTYTYDSRNLLVRVEDSLSNGSIDWDYNADMFPIEETRSNGVATFYGYDFAGRVDEIRQELGGETLANQEYVLNGEGEWTSVDLMLPLEPELIQIKGLPSSLDYDAANQISTEGYGYDRYGRRTSAPGGKQFTYDVAGRLTSIVDGDRTIQFAYDGLHQLIERTENGETTRYSRNLALPLNPVVAESDDEGFKRFFVYNNFGRLLYSVDPDTGDVRYYHFDKNGSTLFLTDDAGDVTDAYAYDSYGNLLGQDGSSDQPFTFIGQAGVRSEPACDLYQMRLRYYDPATASFLTRDNYWPIDPDARSANPYQYAARNPHRYIDPLGTVSEATGFVLIVIIFIVGMLYSSQSEGFKTEKAFGIMMLYLAALNGCPPSGLDGDDALDLDRKPQGTQKTASYNTGAVPWSIFDEEGIQSFDLGSNSHKVFDDTSKKVSDIGWKVNTPYQSFVGGGVGDLYTASGSPGPSLYDERGGDLEFIDFCDGGEIEEGIKFTAGPDGRDTTLLGGDSDEGTIISLNGGFARPDEAGDCFLNGFDPSSIYNSNLDQAGAVNDRFEDLPFQASVRIQF